MKRWFVTFHEAELPVSHHPYWVIEVEAKTKYSAIMQAQKEVGQDCGEYHYQSVVDMTLSDFSVKDAQRFLNGLSREGESLSTKCDCTVFATKHLLSLNRGPLRTSPAQTNER